MTPTDLTSRRLRLGLTEAQLAAVLGTHRTAVIRWERGQRPIPPYLWRAMRDIERERGLAPWPTDAP